MAKVLFPAYFPVNPNFGYSCNDLTGWGGLNLTQAMTAYWKVKSWGIAINAGLGGNLGGTLNVSSPSFGSPALIETDLVCPTSRGTNFPAQGEVTDGSFFVDSSGWSLNVNFREFGSMIFPGEGTSPASFSVTIIGLQDEPVYLFGDCGTDLGGGVSATISATSFWPYEL